MDINNEKWVYDSAIDYEGNIPLRASTGSWKAAFLIIVFEFCERVSYFGLVINLITYLTKVLDQDLQTAAKNVNYWMGVTTSMPLIGGFLADAYTGRYKAIVFSSILYILGLCLLAMSQYIPSIKPCLAGACQEATNKIHYVIFFIAIYMISIGTGGHKPNLESFGADQFDDGHVGESRKKLSYFNWWNFGLCCGILFGATVISYVEDFVGWGVAAIILTLLMAVGLALFLFRTPVYRYRVPAGSPLTPMVQVLVAAMAKRNLPLPANPLQLHQMNARQQGKKRILCHTNKHRYLDKAAIIEEQDKTQNRTDKLGSWLIATVTEVEELKLIINMIPIWLTSLTLGIFMSQTTTFFIKQASTMNRNLTPHFIIPAASATSFCTLAIIITVTIYEKVLVPIFRRTTGNERGITILQRIGIGMALSVIGMVIAAIVETKRLHAANSGEPTLSIFWLAPQFIVLGMGDAFAVVGLQEYFYDQAPDNMRSLGIAFYLSAFGVANFISSFLITEVDHVSKKINGRSWFAKDLSNSRLDNFYWLLAVMGGINLCAYVVLARQYDYKIIDSRIANDSGGKGDEQERLFDEENI